MTSVVSSLSQMTLAGAFAVEKYFQMYFNISLGVVRSLPLSPCGLAVRRLPRMQEVVGSNPTEDKIWFSHFTLISRVTENSK